MSEISQVLSETIKLQEKDVVMNELSHLHV